MPDSLAENEQTEGGSQDEIATAMSTSMPPDYVRNSPEYRELQKQLRDEARRRGSAEAELGRARAAAESARQAAEAQAEAARQVEIESILGADGVAFWNEFAELSATNPTEAARRLAAFQKAQAQSLAPAGSQAAPVPAPAQETEVTEPQSPPSGLRAVGDAPLGQRSDDQTQFVASLEDEYNSVVKRNLDPTTRNRVTMKERGNGLIAYLLAAYTKSGAKPKG